MWLVPLISYDLVLHVEILVVILVPRWEYPSEHYSSTFHMHVMGIPALITDDNITIRFEHLNHSYAKMATKEIGSHPAVQPTDDRNQKIEHRAKFRSTRFDACDFMINRKYFTVYDNAIEWNRPSNCALGCRSSYGVRGYEHYPNCLICVLPSNCCCIGYDEITKMVWFLACRTNFKFD